MSTYIHVKRKKGKSPICGLDDSSEAMLWAKDKLKEIQAESTQKLPYYAPELPRRAYLLASQFFLEKLIAGEKVEAWEANRTLTLEHGDSFSQQGFADACLELFG